MYILKLQYKQQEKAFKRNCQILYKIKTSSPGFDLKPVFQLADLQQPYSNVIKRMCEIETTGNPVTKYDYISSLQDLICEAIDNYLQENQSNKQIAVDADTLISILVYSLIQTNKCHWRSQYEYINKFISSEVIDNGDQGSYLFSVFSAAILYLEELNLKKIKEDFKIEISEEEYNNSNNSLSQTASITDYDTQSSILEDFQTFQPDSSHNIINQAVTPFKVGEEAKETGLSKSSIKPTSSLVRE